MVFFTLESPQEPGDFAAVLLIRNIFPHFNSVLQPEKISYPSVKINGFP